MDISKLLHYWNDIPTGKENAATYAELCARWNRSERQVRAILHELSSYDNGDNLVLVRSASGKGFYKTDDGETLRAYRKECLSKGKSVLAPVQKINRILRDDEMQISFTNNLRSVRESKGMKQRDVCSILKTSSGLSIDNAMLSKMENSVCMPTPFILLKLAEIYDVTPAELISIDLYP